MGLQHFQPDETLPADTSLRAQRMTADEAASVIALWQQEQTEMTGLTDRPAVPDVAEGLDITVEDVQRLLQSVRTQRLEQERLLAAEQELSEVRLAEEARQLAEIQRQRAELRREQAEAERRMEEEQGQFSQSSAISQRHKANPVSVIVAVIFLLFWFYILFGIITSQNSGTHFGNSPSAVDCAITSPDGKSEPCTPEMREEILHGHK